MKPRKRHPIWNWVIHTPWVLTVIAILCLIGFFGSGAGNPVLRQWIIHGLETATGGRVELDSISIRWLSLQATLRGLIIHGLEPAGAKPFFSAADVQAGLRVDSFWGRKVSLSNLSLKKPEVHIRVARDGSTNVPTPQHRLTGSKMPLHESLFALHFGRIQIEDGSVFYNETKMPLAVQGGDLQFGLDAGGTAEHPLYLGNIEWQTIHFSAGKIVPISANLTAKFTLWRDGFTLEQGVLSAQNSHLDVQAEMADFTKPHWTFRYRGWVELQDIRDTLRAPMTPTGHVDVRGEGTYANGQYNGTGGYAGRDIHLTYKVFHAAGLTSRGSYTVNNDGLIVPDFLAEAFGGSVKGKVTLRFAGLKFRVDTHVQDARLSDVLAAIEHPNFPINELDWDARISAETVETWTNAFHDFQLNTKMDWLQPNTPAPFHVPVTGSWQIRYVHDSGLLAVSSGDFQTPSSSGVITGILAPRNSALDVHFETKALESFRHFVNAIRGAAPGSRDAIKELSGSAQWDGKLSGPDGRPTFTGHAKGNSVRYEGVALDSVEGDVTYSADGLDLSHGSFHFGPMSTQIEGTLDLTDWSFSPDNEWTADVNFDKAPVDTIQRLIGSKYPVKGVLSGQFHGHGTRAAPAVTGLFDLAEGEVYGLSINRLRGQLNLASDEIRVADAELRVFAPGKESGRGAGIITGSAGYRFSDQNISLDLVGASLPLEKIEKLQTARLPVGGGITFRLKSAGAISAPQGEGTFRVVDLRVGKDVIGSFEGTLNADGSRAKLDLSSAMTTGGISGQLVLGLADPYPLNGKVSIKNIDLNPFLITAMHLSQFNGQGVADGDITVAGNVKTPESLVLDANFSRLALTYAKVQLENAGAIRLRTSKDSLELDQATFKGANTNIAVSGSVRFANRGALGLKLNGGLDLRLLSGYLPSLDANGPAQINASFEGPFDRPRITGKVHIEKASARVADFPTGMSNITGDLVFDATRLFFDNVTAESGGGTLHLTGSVNYADKPLRYDVTMHTDQVRIRYPEGLSWLAGGSLRLSGTMTSGVLSGRVAVERVTMLEGLEAAGLLVASKSDLTGPTTSSTYLRNLQFDIEALSAPDARMEWPGAELQAEASLRVRGTWEHPILLGHIRILSGDLSFHGDRYRVTRGDLNFSNPFRLDPVLNVEATTTIQQYEITLNFSGPASKLTLAYRSDPPLPANDIITLLALGQTESEAAMRSGTTATGQTASTGASAILSEAVSSQLGGRLERLFGITRFRVDPGLAEVGSTGSSQNAAARVTVEQQVTRNLTITYVSNVGSTQQQVIQVEYNLDRNVSVVMLRDYNGTFGVDFKIKKHFE
ncbi:MAG TPA: translocation/assembly module TamB domain-containing protein [Candidatus Methylomirabilis sp.]|nr:translocation/assembly module TamB domain-containing protein [Candidatus Methylomirabilis sp.]